MSFLEKVTETARIIFSQPEETKSKSKPSAGKSSASQKRKVYEPQRVSASGLREMNSRMFGVMIGMLVGAVAIIGMLAWHHIINREFYQSKTTDQQLYDITIPAKRGSICDVNGEIIVQSTTAWVVYLHPKTILSEKYEYKDVLFQKLCEVVGFTEDYLERRVNAKDENGNRYPQVKLNIKINKTQYDELYAFIRDEKGKIVIGGISFTQDAQRSYAHGNLLSTVLGFAGIDNVGLYGLEALYESTLAGTPGRLVTVQNAREGDMPFEYTTLVEAQEGNSLILSIDANIQQILEKYLAKAAVENKVENRACGILMNVNTGAILAMATYPDYDPANFDEIGDEKLAQQIANITDSAERAKALSQAQQIQWSNKCISEFYEPGSVFKPIVMASALEEGVVSLSSRFNCTGVFTYKGGKIACHKAAGHGSESLSEGMMNSCNPVFIALGDRLGASKFYEYFSAFGFTEKTGIDLPSEGTPTAGVSHYTEKSLQSLKRNLYISSFGQGNTVTPLQMITAIAAIANGGYLLEPYVVEQIIDSNGNIISTSETTVRRQVISEEVSDIVCEMLEATVSGGTAKNGYIAGYRIGGKTGTSEKLVESAQSGQRLYVASYCAIAPSDDPEIALLIVLDEPKGASHMGGAIAAPVARNVLNEVLPYLGIETIYTSEDIATLDTVTPNLISKSLSEAKQEVSAKELKYRVIGDGSTVTAQVPQPGQSIPRGGTVIICTRSSGEIPTTVVPDVTGMTPAKANKALTNAGLNIRYGGTGYDTTQGVAKSQSIPHGTEVSEGTVVTVEFIMSGSTD